jgi:uncharacterized protein YndB with AHSA1/START domain
MTDALAGDTTRDIVVSDFFPHAADTVWKALTNGALMSRWLMEPAGFEPVVGSRFTFRTTPGGKWDGTIRCEVLEATPGRRLVYSWKGGHEENVGYGSPLDTVVTWELDPREGGTQITLTHAGFELPRNESAFRTMSGGWKTVVPRLRATADDLD